MSTIRKSIFSVSVGSLLALGAATHANSLTQSNSGQAGQASPGKQSQQAVKSISGKVSAIGNGGTAFTLEVAGGDKKTMDFVVDKNTQVQGQVRAGSAVTVEYQAMETGQYLAVSVTAQG
jgi:hypothetical protein